MSLEDKFGAAEFAAREKVTIPGIGDVWVGEMDGPAHDQWSQNLHAQKQCNKYGMIENFSAALVAFTTYEDETSPNLAFGPAKIAWLGKRPARLLEPIVKVAMKINGLSDKEVEKIQKNLPSDQIGSHGSDSPVNSDVP